MSYIKAIKIGSDDLYQQELASKELLAEQLTSEDLYSQAVATREYLQQQLTSMGSN